MITNCIVMMDCCNSNDRSKKSIGMAYIIMKMNFYIKISLAFLLFALGIVGIFYFRSINNAVEQELPIIMPDTAVNNFKETPKKEYDQDIPHLDKTFYKELDDHQYDKNNNRSILSTPETPLPQISQEKLHQDFDSIKDNASAPKVEDSKIPLAIVKQRANNQEPSISIQTNENISRNEGHNKYYVQLGSFPTETIARQEMQRIKKQYSSLSKVALKIVKVDLGKPKGVRYRVYGGVLEHSHADRLCQSIGRSGGSCIVARRYHN